MPKAYSQGHYQIKLEKRTGFSSGVCIHVFIQARQRKTGI